MKQKLLDLLRSIQIYLPRLIKASEQMAEDIQTGNEGKALGLLPEYIDGLMWSIEAIEAVKRVDNNYLKDVQLEDISQPLNILEEAMLNQDYILLADIFEYEVKPRLTDYCVEINGLLAEINAG